MDATIQAAREQSRGGAWTDANLQDTIEWRGDTGSNSTPSDGKLTFVPTTTAAEQKGLLENANITNEVLEALVTALQKKLLRRSGLKGDSIMAALQDDTAARIKNVESWLLAQTKSQSTVQVDTALTQKLTKLEEQIVNIENKLNEVISKSASQGQLELTVLNEAIAIVRETRKAEVDTDRTPSEVDRMQIRATTLENTVQHLAALNVTSTATKKSATSVNKAKFGRLM